MLLLRLQEIGRFRGWGGTCSFQDLIDGMGCWSHLPAGNLPADRLEKLRRVGKGPREWGVPSGGWLLTS